MCAGVRRLSLLDALGIDRCHLLGHSMGGMVSQILAADHPERVLSLTSLSSCTDVQVPASRIPPGRGGVSPKGEGMLSTVLVCDAHLSTPRTATWGVGVGVGDWVVGGFFWGGLMPVLLSCSKLTICGTVATVRFQGCPGVPQPTLYELWKLRQSPIAAQYIDEPSFQAWWDAGKDALRFSYPTEPHFKWDEEGFKYMFRRRNLRMPDDDANIDRQLHAIMCCPDRRPGLRTVRIPTLIAHGTADPVMPIQNAITTKENVEHAQMLLIPHMKHILPEECFGDFVDAFVAMAATCAVTPVPKSMNQARTATSSVPTVELEISSDAKLADERRRALLQVTTR